MLCGGHGGRSRNLYETLDNNHKEQKIDLKFNKKYTLSAMVVEREEVFFIWIRMSSAGSCEWR